MEEEQSLAGGNAGGTVVRIGRTVRKPWTAATPAVVSFVEHLRAAGVDAPAPLGRDEAGRRIQEYVPGRLAMDAGPLSPDQLRRVGAMVRRIHDAGGDFVPPPGAVWVTAIPAPGDELICHNDLAPWNLIVGDRWVFIDWDASAPSTRLWDLAYAAQAFTLNDAGRAPEDSARDLAAFVDGYGAEPELRRRLPAEMGRRTRAMYDLLHSSSRSGREPWATMFATGHGEHWRTVTRYVTVHREVWARALGAGARDADAVGPA